MQISKHDIGLCLIIFLMKFFSYFLQLIISNFDLDLSQDSSVVDPHHFDVDTDLRIRMGRNKVVMIFKETFIIFIFGGYKSGINFLKHFLLPLYMLPGTVFSVTMRIWIHNTAGFSKFLELAGCKSYYLNYAPLRSWVINHVLGFKL